MTAAEYKYAIRHHLLHAYMLSEEKIDSYLPRFLDALQEHLEKLQQPLQTNNFKEVSTAAHTLKGALLNLGLHELADMACRMEQADRAKNGMLDYQVLYTQLHKEISSFAGADPNNDRKQYPKN